MVRVFVRYAEYMSALWYVYMVQCADSTFYTGVTTDVARRVAEHNGARAAKYTRARQPVVLVYSEIQENRSVACSREAAIKKLSRNDKAQLVMQ